MWHFLPQGFSHFNTRVQTNPPQHPPTLFTTAQSLHPTLSAAQDHNDWLKKYKQTRALYIALLIVMFSHIYIHKGLTGIFIFGNYATAHDTTVTSCLRSLLLVIGG